MPSIDLGQVVGPQGEAGPQGPQGIQGVAGPNQITSATSTTLNGVLMGSGGIVGVRAVDSTPTALSTNLVSSGGVQSALSSVVASEIVVVTISSFNGTQTTFSAPGVTAQHAVLECYLSNPLAQVGTWVVSTTTDGFTITGTVSDSTSVTLVLGIRGTSISAT